MSIQLTSSRISAASFIYRLRSLCVPTISCISSWLYLTTFAWPHTAVHRLEHITKTSTNIKPPIFYIRPTNKNKYYRKNDKKKIRPLSKRKKNHKTTLTLKSYLEQKDTKFKLLFFLIYINRIQLSFFSVLYKISTVIIIIV